MWPIMHDLAFLLNATAIGIHADYVAHYVYTAGIDGIVLENNDAYSSLAILYEI